MPGSVSATNFNLGCFQHLSYTNVVWYYDNRSHAWQEIISRLGEISLPVLMPQLSVEVHNTLLLAAGRRMHLRLEGVVKRVPRMCDIGLRGVPILLCGTVLIRERDCTFGKKQIAGDIARGPVTGALLGSAPD